jgi:quinolinate synthase
LWGAGRDARSPADKEHSVGGTTAVAERNGTFGGELERAQAVVTPVHEAQVEAEALRLLGKLRHVGWSLGECELIAPLTLEINELKRAQNAVILAHSYQTPDIIYGIADFVSDSLALSTEASRTSADKIVFCGVRFMAETAKILCPEKTVIHPDMSAGCSLADGITAEDVRELKRQHPGVPVVAYVNTSAEVKAEADACCTSANTLAVVEAMPGDSVIFIPDKLMAANLRPLTKKNIFAWNATCIVHENFGEAEMRSFRRQYPGAKLLAHTECHPGVVDLADMAGSTSGMEKYIEQHPEDDTFMLVTECGMTDKLKAQYPARKFVGMCVLCPYMKKIELRNVLQAMQAPRPDQVVELAPDTIQRARKSIDVMLEIGRSDRTK